MAMKPTVAEARRELDDFMDHDGVHPNTTKALIDAFAQAVRAEAVAPAIDILVRQDLLVETRRLRALDLLRKAGTP